MPKYKGNSDDWLDNEKTAKKSGKRPRAAKAPESRSAELDQSAANATVVEVFPKLCRVRLDEDQKEILCSYRRAQVFQIGELRERSPVCVGDRIKAQVLSPQSGVIENRCVRSNRLARPSPDRDESSVHIIAANVDVVAIVTSVYQPDFSMGIVDRFLTAAYLQKISPIVVVNKIDLLESGESNLDQIGDWKVYSDLGIPVYLLSCKKGAGLDRLREHLQHKTVVFCGHSGVGKSSLLTALMGKVVATTGEVNSHTGKGKHTTTSTIMMTTPDGSRWIDTPGVKEFGLLDIEPQNLAEAYPEFSELTCTQNGCLHDDQPDCEAESLPRYPSYRRILQSLIDGPIR